MTKSLIRTSIVSTGLIAAFALVTGVASADEGKTKGHRDGHGMFERLDTNKDGKITKAEAKKVADERFKKLDANNDGTITQDEAKAAHEKMRAERSKDSSAPQAKDGKGGDCGHGKGHGKHGARGHGHFFKQADANNDGKVTRAEAQKMHDAHFAEMDLNKDGSVTKEEAQKAFEAMREKRREERKNSDGNKTPKAKAKGTTA